MDNKIYKHLKVHNVKEYPKTEDYRSNELTELSDWDLDKLVLLGIDECWYWYATGSYEGSGKILMRKGDLYDYADIGCCSCNEPTDRITFDGKKIDEINMSAEYERSIKGLKKFAGII